MFEDMHVFVVLVSLLRDGASYLLFVRLSQLADIQVAPS